MGFHYNHYLSVTKNNNNFWPLNQPKNSSSNNNDHYQGQCLVGVGWVLKKGEAALFNISLVFLLCCCFSAACKIAITTTAAGMKIQCYFSYHTRNSLRNSNFENELCSLSLPILSLIFCWCCCWLSNMLLTCCQLFFVAMQFLFTHFFAPPFVVYIYRYTFTFCATLAPAPPTFPPPTHRILSMFCL